MIQVSGIISRLCDGFARRLVIATVVTSCSHVRRTLLHRAEPTIVGFSDSGVSGAPQALRARARNHGAHLCKGFGFLRAWSARAYSGDRTAHDDKPSQGAGCTAPAISIECSKQADAKGLHGKARHSFRASASGMVRRPPSQKPDPAKRCFRTPAFSRATRARLVSLSLQERLHALTAIHQRIVSTSPCDPAPSARHVVPIARFIQLLPKLDILDRLPVGVSSRASSSRGSKTLCRFLTYSESV